jgi:RNA polymerase sigma-70 factor, ECF subfamily
MAYLTQKDWNPLYFGEVVTRFQSRIIQYILKLTGDEELAKDLAQDVFLTAYKALIRRAQGEITLREENMLAWLYTIARNKTMDEMRRRKGKQTVSFWQKRDEEETNLLALIPADEDNFIEDRAVLKDSLQQAMQKVEPSKLNLFLLSLEGFSYQELTTLSGKSISNVKTSIFRVRERLRREYQSSV